MLFSSQSTTGPHHYIAPLVERLQNTIEQDARDLVTGYAPQACAPIARWFGNQLIFLLRNIVDRAEENPDAQWWENRLERYPVAERIVNGWIYTASASVITAMKAVEACGDELPALGVERWPENKVVSVTPLVDDPADMRQFFSFAFSDGAAVVFKSRGADTDALLQGVANSLSQLEGRNAPVLVPRSLSCAYGVLYEFVKPRPVADESEFGAYYWNCGFLLGVAYFLGGTDFHFQNIIPVDKNPIVIDTEKTAAPLDTGMSDWTICNMGMLRNASINRIIYPSFSTFEMGKHSASAFGPSIVSAIPSYQDSLIGGFSFAYDSAVAHRDFLSTSVDVRELFNCEIRYSGRQAGVHAVLFAFATKPEYLENEEHFRALGSYLDEFYEIFPLPKRIEEVSLKAEYDAFYALMSPRVVDRFGPGPDNALYSAFLERLRSATDADKAYQQRLISASLSSAAAIEFASLPNGSETSEFDSKQVSSTVVRCFDYLEARLLADDAFVVTADITEDHSYLLFKNHLCLPGCWGGIMPAAKAWSSEIPSAHSIYETLIARFESSFAGLQGKMDFGDLTNGLAGTLHLCHLMYELSGEEAFLRVGQRIAKDTRNCGLAVFDNGSVARSMKTLDSMGANGGWASRAAEILRKNLDDGESPLGEPSGFVAPSLYYGAGGVLYALARFSHPNLPPLFDERRDASCMNVSDGQSAEIGGVKP